jgi:peptide/histidine transporter 3/4
VFLKKNTEGIEDEEHNSQRRTMLWGIVGFLGVVLPVVAGITLPYINPWSVRFGVPALCTLLATFLFITGSRSYQTWCEPEGSPVTAVFRVFVASTYKIFKPLPQDVSTKNDESSTNCPYPNLRFLDKAGIILPNVDEVEQQKNKWTFCKPEKIEATKKIVRILPICFTFVICGVVLSIGNTYFVEQANNLNRKVGSLTVPLSLFLAFYEFAKMSTSKLYSDIVMQNDLLKTPSDEEKKKQREIGIKAPIIAIFFVYVYIELSCITAAKVEQRRLHTVRRHDLLDKPDDDIPMSIFWLLPQFLLIASADGLYKSSVKHFFAYHAPWCMYEYRSFFHKAVMGLGTMGSVLCVFIVGKVSANGGRPNWFQFTLNRSRLDRYYWTLSVLCAVNLALYSLALYFYDRSKLLTEDPDEEIDLSDLDESA